MFKVKKDKIDDKDTYFELEEYRCCGSPCGVSVVAWKNGIKIGTIVQLSHEGKKIILDKDYTKNSKDIGLKIENKFNKYGNEYEYPKIERL